MFDFTTDVGWLWKAVMMLTGDGENRLAHERGEGKPSFHEQHQIFGEEIFFFFFAVRERMN